MTQMFLSHDTNVLVVIVFGIEIEFYFFILNLFF
jgi:hypothetical protein